jgi:hypothetical protein
VLLSCYYCRERQGQIAALKQRALELKQKKLEAQKNKKKAAESTEEEFIPDELDWRAKGHF